MGWIIVASVVTSLAISYWMRSHAPKSVAPKPGKPEAPTSNEGALIPVVFGTVQIKDTTLVWNGPATVTPAEKPAGVYCYYMSWQAVICQGELDDVRAFVVDGKVIWEGRTPGNGIVSLFNHMIFGGLDAGGGIVGDVRVSKGGFSTGRHAGVAMLPAIAAGFNDGSGPGYFGIATVTLNNVYIGTSPYPKPWSFRVQRIHKTDGGAAQWYDAKAEISTGKDRQDYWAYCVIPPGYAAYDTDFSQPSESVDDWEVGYGGFTTGETGTDGHGSPWNTCIVEDPETQPPTGTKIWIRCDLGPMNQEAMGAQLWDWGPADGQPTLYPNRSVYFNGHYVALGDFIGDNSLDPGHVSAGRIKAEWINPAGPNIVAAVVKTVSGTIGRIALQVGTNADVIPDNSAVPVSGHRANMNAIHIIRECLTSKIFGLAQPELMIGDSFEAAADICYSEGLGLSLEWNKEGSVKDLISEILRHISGTLYQDRVTGKWEIRLVRADYDREDLIVLDESNTERVTDVARCATSSLVNTIQVSYTNSLNGDSAMVSAPDTALIREQGRVVPMKLDYPAITSHAIAHRAALRNLKVFSAPLLSCSVVANRIAANLNKGDVFILNRPDRGVTDLVMRVTEISLGDGLRTRVEIKAVEDVFDSPQSAFTTPSAGGHDPIPPVYDPPTTKFYAVNTTDKRDRTAIPVLSLFVGTYPGGTAPLWGPFAETSPGVMTATVIGPSEGLTGWLDGINCDPMNPESDHHLGSLFFAYGAGLSAESTGQGGTESARLQGLWVLQDVGGYWADENWVSTYIRFTRAGEMADGSTPPAGLTLAIDDGNHAGRLYRLVSEGATIGTTPLEFEELDSEPTWDGGDFLVTDEQPEDDSSLEISTSDLVETISASAAFDNGVALGANEYPTLEGTPCLRTSPRGQWSARVEDAHITTAGDVGSETRLIAKVYRKTLDDLILLYTLTSDPLGETEATALALFNVLEPTDTEITDRICVKFGIVTTSQAFVMVTLTTTGGRGNTYLEAPLVPSKDIDLLQHVLRGQRGERGPAGGAVSSHYALSAASRGFTDDQDDEAEEWPHPQEGILPGLIQMRKVNVTQDERNIISADPWENLLVVGDNENAIYGMEIPDLAEDCTAEISVYFTVERQMVHLQEGTPAEKRFRLSPYVNGNPVDQFTMTFPAKCTAKFAYLGSCWRMTSVYIPPPPNTAGYLGRTVFLHSETPNRTYTPPACTVWVKFKGRGGRGGGGSVCVNEDIEGVIPGAAASGGGDGDLLEGVIDITGAEWTFHSINVGAGGTGGAATSSTAPDGSAGGDTSMVTNVQYTAKGGLGGAGSKPTLAQLAYNKVVVLRGGGHATSGAYNITAQGACGGTGIMSWHETPGKTTAASGCGGGEGGGKSRGTANGAGWDGVGGGGGGALAINLTGDPATTPVFYKGGDGDDGFLWFDAYTGKPIG